MAKPAPPRGKAVEAWKVQPERDATPVPASVIRYIEKALEHGMFHRDIAANLGVQIQRTRSIASRNGLRSPHARWWGPRKRPTRTR